MARPPRPPAIAWHWRTGLSESDGGQAAGLTKGPVFEIIDKIGTEPNQDKDNACSKREGDPSHNNHWLGEQGGDEKQPHNRQEKHQ